jgi:hypothetical protein
MIRVFEFEVNPWIEIGAAVDFCSDRLKLDVHLLFECFGLLDLAAERGNLFFSFIDSDGFRRPSRSDLALCTSLHNRISEAT